MARLVVDNIGLLATMDGSGAHGLGVVADAYVIADNGRVSSYGPRADLPTMLRVIPTPPEVDAPPGTVVHVDAGGRCVLPGLVDCHTHAVFLGDRADEHARRARGESYAAIMAAGGGIRATMRAVRGASVQALVDAAIPRLAAMLARGVTTVEIKSGYGLDVASELAMLRAIRALGAAQPVDVTATLLAAHAIPPEHEGAPGAWIDVIVRDLLPEVARDQLASACDVFVEQGAFGVDDARRMLTRAQELGLAVRVHAEQLTRSGGAQLAAELRALSAGHLENVDASDIAALAKAGVVCEVLPIAQVFLRGQRATPGRALVDGGCTVAVATDCNPGTAMSTDLPLAGGLAVTQCGLTVEEALLGMTAHAARAAGFTDRGVIAPGKRADLLVLDAPTPAHVVYRWSEPLAHTVVIGGRVVFRRNA